MYGNVINNIKNYIINKLSKNNNGSFFNTVNENSDQNALKMVNEVINDMCNSNDIDIKKIANNLHYIEINNGSILFKNNNTNKNYFCKNNEFGSPVIMLNVNSEKNVVAHEFGHLIQDLVDESFPNDYEEVKNISINNLKTNAIAYKQLLDKYIERYNIISDKVLNELQEFKNNNLELFKKMEHEILDDKDKSEAFILKHAAALSEKDRNDLLKSPVSLSNFINQNILMDQYNEKMLQARMSDNYLSQIVIVNDIIKSIYDGEKISIINEDKYVLFDDAIYNHTDEYYNLEVKMNFKEQFANYMELKIYPEKYMQTINTLKSLIGDEWFQMMDEKFKKIANIMSNEENMIK